MEPELLSWLPPVGASVMVLLGSLHLLYTVQDFGESPRHFSPKNSVLLAQMRETRTALAPRGRDYWSGILGFHLSHSMGVLMFSLLIILADQYQIGWLKPFLVVIAFLYAGIAHRCWFKVPMLGTLVAGVLLAAGWAPGLLQGL